LPISQIGFWLLSFFELNLSKFFNLKVFHFAIVSARCLAAVFIIDSGRCAFLDAKNCVNMFSYLKSLDFEDEYWFQWFVEKLIWFSPPVFSS
jgi:hypothetical protein